jgi:hypothetical protein
MFVALAERKTHTFIYFAESGKKQPFTMMIFHFYEAAMEDRRAY